MDSTRLLGLLEEQPQIERDLYFVRREGGKVRSKSELLKCKKKDGNNEG